MLKLFRKFAGPCVLMAVLAGAVAWTRRLFNASAVPATLTSHFAVAFNILRAGFVQRMYTPIRKSQGIWCLCDLFWRI